MGENIAANKDGQWQLMTDERIRAVMPLAGGGWSVFGSRGLSAVRIPVLTIDAENNELYSEKALIFAHLSLQEKTFIIFWARIA